MTILLLEKGANVNAQDKSNATPLHYAVKKNNYKIVKLLLDYGANLEILDQNGTAP